MEKSEKRGRGRPEGSVSKLAREARQAAQATGRLPHEILLDIARGNPQTIFIPQDDGTIAKKLVPVTLDQCTDAAKAAAPYYAPKISTVEVISGVSDDDLDAIIASAAAAAGVSVSFGREGTADEEQDAGTDRPTGRRRVRLLD